ncbi:MAG: hypothetical protein GY835_13505 [bacterium]|nr:hypothetical protein [bacterium]
MKNSRLIPILLAFILLAPSLALGFNGNDNAMALPDDLVKLLPADATILAASSCLTKLDSQLIYLFEDPDDPAVPTFSLVDSLLKAIRIGPEFIALDKPIALTVSMPLLMGGSSMPLTLIFATQGTDEEIEDEIHAHDFPSWHRSGDYLALSLDPSYSPTGSTPRLAADFPLHLASGRVDLAALIEMFNPFVDMWLQSQAMKADSQTRFDDQDGSYTSDDAGEDRILIDLVQGLTESLQELEWTFAEGDGELILDTSLKVLPDSPFAPMRPAPFEDALDLTGILPHDDHLQYASALCEFRYLDLYLEYSRIGLEQGMREFDADKTREVMNWFDSYLDLVHLYFRPIAGSASFDGDNWRAQIVVQSESAEADMAKIVGVVDGYPDLGIGISMQAQDTPHKGGHAWRVEVDPEAVAIDPEDGTPTIDPMDLEQLSLMMSKFVPGIYLATQDDYLLISIDDGPDGIADMLKAIRRKRTPADPRIKRAAGAAGPDCRQIIVGDMQPFLIWMQEFMNEAKAGSVHCDWTQSESMPFVQTLRTDDHKYNLSLSISAETLKAYIQGIDKTE